MSIEVISAVWKRSRQKSGPLLVLLALADYTNSEGNSWPAVSTLARKARMSKRNTQRCLRALQEAGELEVRPNQGRRGSNIYRITLGGIKLDNTDARVVGDRGVAKPVTSSSLRDDTSAAQSVTKSLKESTPIVPTGDEIDFWVKVCLECFEQPYHPIPVHVLNNLARAIPTLDRSFADSLRKFYRYEELNSKEPPYNSRRHSPERLILDLPRQLGLAVQEFPPRKPKQYPFTLDDVCQHLREEYDNPVLPRSLEDLDTSPWRDIRQEIFEALKERNKNR
jgi:hypothetical protein